MGKNRQISLSRILVFSTLLLLSGFSLMATTWDKTELTCPACLKKCSGYTINSTNTFGGQDRDFLRRANAAQVITLAPITCSNCHFSGYRSSFERPQIKEALTSNPNQIETTESQTEQ